jgi:hypothetical protein
MPDTFASNQSPQCPPTQSGFVIQVDGFKNPPMTNAVIATIALLLSCPLPSRLTANLNPFVFPPLSALCPLCISLFLQVLNWTPPTQYCVNAFFGGKTQKFLSLCLFTRMCSVDT